MLGQFLGSTRLNCRVNVVGELINIHARDSWSCSCWSKVSRSGSNGMKSTLILFFVLSPMVLASPFLGNLFIPRETNESHISDFRDKSKAQLQLEDDGQDPPIEGGTTLPPNAEGMGRKFQLYGRLFGNFIGALQNGIGAARVHLSSVQEKKNITREPQRKIDVEEVTEQAIPKSFFEQLRERKLVFLTTNVLPNLVSAWRSVMGTFSPPNSLGDEAFEDLEKEESAETMKAERLQLSPKYLPARENSWEMLGRIIKSFNSERRSAKLEEDSQPKVNGVLMLELFGTIFGVTWNILSQIRTLLGK